MTRVAVVGGGAAGLVAAIEAARAGAQVTVLEAADRVGKTILATGNGRCNIGNATVTPHDYNNPEFAAQAFDTLPPESVQGFFSDAGLLLFEEDEGRLYPYSNKASTVLDMLRLCAAEAGAAVRVGARVAAVEPAAGVPQTGEGAGWDVRLENGQAERFDAVIVAVGGFPHKGIVPASIPFKPCRPVLAPLKTDTETIQGLSGIRVRARLYLDEDPADLRDAWLDVVDPDFQASFSGPEEQGEVLFRDYGISGIATFDMSRHVRPGTMVFMDLAPDLDPQEKVDFIYNVAMMHPNRTAEQVLAGMLPARVARAVSQAAGINPDEPIVAEEEAVVLAMATESFGVTVRGIADPKQAQVARGGYAVDAFDARTMECGAQPGLFMVGEALDMDGRCGGYNLHWAWTSGMLAGRAAAGAPEVCGVQGACELGYAEGDPAAESAVRGEGSRRTASGEGGSEGETEQGAGCRSDGNGHDARGRKGGAGRAGSPAGRGGAAAGKKGLGRKGNPGNAGGASRKGAHGGKGSGGARKGPQGGPGSASGGRRRLSLSGE